MILQLLFSEPLVFTIWIIAIFVGITVHEFAHAFAAYSMGDPTAKSLGRLTLNPLAHLDIFGLIFLLVAGFGYGKPVPVNPYNFRNQKWGEIIVSGAGPFSNLVQILVFGMALKFLVFLGPANLLVNFLFALIYINIILMVFNLLPIPPLDGSKIFFNILPSSLNNFKIALERLGPMILLFIIILDRISNLGLFASMFSFIGDLIFKLFS